MNEQQRAAMEQAREALAASDDFLFNYHDCEPNNEREMDAYSEIRANNHEAFTALTAALEQPAQQEPVAWYDEEMDSAYTESELGDGNTDGLEPLYTRPQAREPLINEQIGQAAKDAHIAFCLGKHQTYEQALTRAIETKLREKNA